MTGVLRLASGWCRGRDPSFSGHHTERRLAVKAGPTYTLRDCGAGAGSLSPEEKGPTRRTIAWCTEPGTDDRTGGESTSRWLGLRGRRPRGGRAPSLGGAPPGLLTTSSSVWSGTLGRFWSGGWVALLERACRYLYRCRHGWLHRHCCASPESLLDERNLGAGDAGPLCSLRPGLVRLVLGHHAGERHVEGAASCRDSAPVGERAPRLGPQPTAVGGAVPTGLASPSPPASRCPR